MSAQSRITKLEKVLIVEDKKLNRRIHYIEIAKDQSKEYALSKYARENNVSLNELTEPTIIIGLT